MIKYFKEAPILSDNTERSNMMTAEHISGANLEYFEAARTGFFTFIIDLQDNNKLVDACKAKTFNDQLAISNPDDDVYDNDKVTQYLKLNVVKCAVPHFSVQALEYKRGNEVVKFAGVPTFDAGSLVVDDVVGLDTKGILMAWQALVYDVKTRKGGRMKDYKINCTLAEYTQDYMPIRQWKLYGCWPSALSEGEFDKTADGPRQVTATIQYDRAELQETEQVNG